MRSCSITEVEEGAEVMGDLPEDIVVKIVAMAPFPSIFKAVGLSKAWRSRFLTSVSCKLEDGEERGLAASFQKQVIGEWSKNWEIFSPVFIAKDHLVTYGQKSRNWRTIALSFLPEIFLQSKIASRSLDKGHLHIDGALLYTWSRYSNFHSCEIYVANILTRRWKRLPPPPPPRWKSRVFCSKVVSNTFSGTYNMILFTKNFVHPFSHDGHDHFSVHIYESHSEMWSTIKFAVTADFLYSGATFDGESAGAAYLNGVLYMLTFKNMQHLLAFNFAERTLQELELSFNREDTCWVRDMADSLSLLVCNDDRLMIVMTRYDLVRMLVFEVDLQYSHLIRLSGGPPDPFNVANIYHGSVSDGNCIFFRTQGRGGDEVLAYNVNEDAWSSFPIPGPVPSFGYNTHRFIRSSLQPSLSAFVSL